AALRALPQRAGETMLNRVAESYRSDSGRLLEALERALAAASAPEVARAAHAWRSCNGHVGAQGLMRLCRELENQARSGDLTRASELIAQARLMYLQAQEQLECEIRRSA
ncbi:MAG: Hpt domain-containing protein, partial [Steroidobacteraceae bacterium]